MVTRRDVLRSGVLAGVAGVTGVTTMGALEQLGDVVALFESL